MFGLNRGQQPAAAPAESIDDRYVTALAAWQVARGLNRMDLTREQDARYRAVEAAGGDTTTASRLLFGRRLAQTGRIGRDDR